MMKKISLISFLIGLVLFIYQTKLSSDGNFILWIISIILISLPGVGWLSKCPKCSKWFAEREINKDVLRNWQERKKENNGEYSWYNCEETLVTYKCPDCGHLWKAKRINKNKA